MPILPADYFSNWYVISLDNKARLLQSYNEILNQSADNENYIRGDIGSRIVNIGPKHYQATLNSPILIMDSNAISDSEKMFDIFDLVLDNLIKIQEPVDNNNVVNYNYVLTSASIQLSSDSSSVNATLESWQTIGTQINYNPTTNYNFTARQAKYYDIQFGMFGESYLITNGTINISSNVSKSFFIPGTNDFTGNTTPLYTINSYFINGNVNLIITPAQYQTLKLYNAQSPGIFNAVKQSLFLKVLGRYEEHNFDRILNLGDFMFMPSIDISVSANSPTVANVNFTTMFRSTSEITTS